MPEFQEFKSPLSVHFELTSACNHKCIHCYNYWREPCSSAQIMKRDEMQRILENLIKCDIQDIIFTGGEPLLCPELLLEAIDIAQEAGVSCNMNSNLTLLTHEIAAELNARGMHILTSFPSYDPETFDKIVGKKGAFDNAVSGIRIALEHDIPVTANMVAMRQNLGHVIPTGHYLKSLGVNGFTVTRVQPTLGSKNFDSIGLTHEELTAALDDLLVLKAEGMRVDSLTCYPMCFFDNLDRFGTSIVHRTCYAGKTFGAVGVDGGVRACPQSDIVYGNALKESIYDIWPRMKSWRDGSNLPDACKNCKWVEDCGGGCRVDSFFHHGCADGLDSYAVTDNIEKISFTSVQNSLPPIEWDTALCVSPNIKFRTEKFGVFISNGRNPRLFTRDTAELLDKLKDSTFTVNDLVNTYGLPRSNPTKDFLASLVMNGIVHTAHQNSNNQLGDYS